jgi:hypothetical protein
MYITHDQGKFMKKSGVLLLLAFLILLSACRDNTASIDLFHPMDNEVLNQLDDIKTSLTNTIDDIPSQYEVDVTHGLDIIDRSYYGFYELDDFDVSNDRDFIKVKAYLELILAEVETIKDFTENEYLDVNDQRKIKICLEDEAIKIETISAYEQSNQFFYHITYIGKDDQNRMIYDKLTFEYELDHRNMVISGRETYIYKKSSEVILIDHKSDRLYYESNDYETMSFLYYSTFITESIKYKTQDSYFEYEKLGDRKEVTLYKDQRVLGYLDLETEHIDATFNLLEIPEWNQLIRISDISEYYHVMNDDQILTDSYATISVSAYHMPYISYTIPMEDDGDYHIDQSLDLGVTYQEVIQASQQFDLMIEQAILDLEFTDDINNNIAKMMEGIDYYPSDALIKKYIKLF